MLSYRHSFHAGNFADVLKHIVLVEILEHLIKKESAFEYIDTHAGAGLFNLKAGDATKLEEHINGIGKLKSEDFPELIRYFDVINSFNDSGAIILYPGSPLIAKAFLRRQDRAWLYELHPQDFRALCQNTGNNKKIRIFREDGFEGMNALLPPHSRRALVLIDPSYEIKTDYIQAVDMLVKVHKKFTTGIYAIWYPVIDRNKIERMEKKLLGSGIKNIQRYELGVSKDTDERGMTAAGLFIINPPWGLFEKMSELLPKLAQVISITNELCFKCDVIVNE